MFDREKLEGAKGTRLYNYSAEALQALDDLIDRALDEEGFDDFYDAYWEATDDTFTYYDDAWDYMKKYGDNDLSDAVHEGFTNICQIAGYNLEQEFFGLLKDIGLSTDDFEK